MWKILNNESIKVFDNIKRSFLIIDEFLIFLEGLIDSQNYGIYNVGSKLYSYAERIKYLCKKNKINYKNKIIKTQDDVYPPMQKFNVNKVNKKFNIYFN